MENLSLNVDLNELKNKVIIKFKENVKNKFNIFKDKELKLMFLDRSDFISYFVDIKQLYNSPYEDSYFNYLSSKIIDFIMYEDCENSKQKYALKIYNIFKNSHKEIIECFTEVYLSDYIKNNLNPITYRRLENIIIYILRKELNNFNVREYVNCLCNEYIKELLEKVQQDYDKFNIDDIKEKLENVEYLDEEILLKILLNNKLLNNLNKKEKNKVVKI
jgi:hypothetical protein